MGPSHSLSNDIVIVGGGFSGLSTAASLAHAGLPVTLLESGDLGMHASSVIQGWLYSGAWFAPRQEELARHCHEALRQTIRFCPDCLEPGHTGMLYAFTDATQSAKWTTAWDAAEIPWKALSRTVLNDTLPGAATQLTDVFRLPDRSIRPQILLRQLADCAAARGARIHTGVRVTELNVEDQTVVSVTTGRGEVVAASMVILATGAGESDFSQYLMCDEACSTSLYSRVTLQTHLIATPQLTSHPFCLPEFQGLNHVPHASRGDRAVSIFGLDRWQICSPLTSCPPCDEELGQIREQIRRCFPSADLSGSACHGWNGTTVQVMHADQIEPGRIPLPTVIDHALETPQIDNLLSIYPGRATLWHRLAQQTSEIVLQRMHPEHHRVADPPWV